MSRKCSVSGCNGKHKGLGYCGKHYSQFKKHGRILERTIYDPNDIVHYGDHVGVVLRNKDQEVVGESLVSKEHLYLVEGHKWFKDGRGYAVTRLPDGTFCKMHRLILGVEDGVLVDHKNRNRLDNTKDNIRPCTPSENAMNRGTPSNNELGVKGISYNKSNGKYRARITVDKVTKHLGYFDTLDDAIKAREQAEIALHGDFSSTNGGGQSV